MNETNNTFFNYLNTESVNNIEIIATKSSEKNTFFLGEVFTFTIKITNLSNVNLINVILYEDDLLPEEQYIANTFTINNKNIYISSFPYYGINIGVIPAKTSSIITYQVVFNMFPSTTPQISSHVVIYYNYSDSNNTVISNSIVADSNTITIQNTNPNSILNTTP